MNALVILTASGRVGCHVSDTARETQGTKPQAIVLGECPRSHNINVNELTRSQRFFELFDNQVLRSNAISAPSQVRPH